MDDISNPEQVEATLAKAEELMADGALDLAEQVLDHEIAKLSADISKAKGKKQPPAPNDEYDEEGDDEDDLGKALEDEEADAMAKVAMDQLDTDVNRITKIAKLSEAPGAHPLRKAALAATMDQVEADIDRVAKLGGPVRYPHGTDSDLNDHQNLQHEGSTTTFPDRSQHTTLAAVVEPKPSQFEEKVQQIALERGLSRTAAQTRARIEYPDLFQSFLAGNASEPVQAQQTRQRAFQVDKSAPLTYEYALSAEIAKGFHPRVAAQNVVNRYGNLPSESFAKAKDAEATFKSTAQDLLDEYSNMPRTEALRKCRRERPELFDSLQRI